MGGEFNDAIMLVFYIVLTIMLILIGKLVGVVFYKGYHSLDSGSYKPDSYEIEAELCPQNNNGWAITNDIKLTKCTYTKEQYNAAAEKIAVQKAENDGRWVGGWMGFLLGFLLLANKTYGMYKNSQMSKV